MEEVVQIRLMEVDDLDQVMEVEKDCFPQPWTYSVFFNEITKNQFAYYLVAEVDDKIVGYCGLWVIVDEAHITNIGIHSSLRRQGLGEYLFQGAMEMAKKLGAVKISLEVRVSNKAAQALYRKYGLKDGGIRKKYYTDNQEDALVMWVGLE
ncbi:ribosomal protein S18-alanine N-acetyltransferase [Salipaludibacillus daqingensis]|uniref:ribosomal protein S18-alanine N-acetyltransferase n=1 Tax=Salipaludibacillus daqingensis TaxID=3041001 RepID=UPI002474C2C0|nr:ribosomal protein S18-alanine N-acetyltransferase [Salipaludibacillus daqingensis]